MKKLITLIGIALVVIAPIFAQVSHVATPTNYLQVAEAIYQDGLPAVSVSLTEIEDHLDGIVNAYPFNPNKPAPQLILEEFTSANIKLSWLADPNADHYEIHYLNLNDGTTGVKISSTDEVDIPNPTPGVYAFSIIELSYYNLVLEQTESNIIIKQDIMQFTIPNNNGSCNCDPIASVPIDIDVTGTDVFTGDMNLIASPIGIPEKFRLEIELVAAPTESRHVTFFRAGNNFTVECWDGFVPDDIYEGTGFVLDEYSGTGDFAVAHLESTLFWQLSNFLGPYELSKANIIKCNTGGTRNSEMNEYKVASPLELQPNPVSNFLKINSRSNKTGSLTITNQLGQVMYSKDQAYSNEEVEVSNWPQGIYFVNMKIKGETFQETFVKVAH